MAKVEKTEPKKIGQIGTFRVVEITAGFPLIEIGSVRLGSRKVKAVLDNLDVCKEFVKKYENAKTESNSAVVAQQAAALAKAQAELKALEAKLAAFAQPPTTVTRVDPLQKAA